MFKVPIAQVDVLVILGQVQISTQALLMALEAGVDISFLSQRGRFRGAAISARSKNVPLRMALYELSQDGHRRLEFAKRIVAAKLIGAAKVLIDYHRSQRSDFRFLSQKSFMKVIDRVKSSDSFDSLRGLEGYGTRLYFQGFKKLLKFGNFERREYFPAPDPVNACLSLGYSSIAREMQALLQANGFDPYIGIMHKIVYGRASLSLDMIEEFRHSIIDRFVLLLFNKQILDEDDFEMTDEGCFLQKPNIKRFFTYYEQAMNQERFWIGDRKVSIRELMRRQVEELRRSIIERRLYTPWHCEVSYEEDTSDL